MKPSRRWLSPVGRRSLGALCFVVLASSFAVSDEPAPTTRKWNFENDVVPILSKFGCNTSGCHGKAEGQNGFKLSVFGFDPSADYAAIVKEGRGRRVVAVSPERSLLLQKASGRIPHGGGVRLDPSRVEYARLRDWIADGAPLGSADDPRVVGLELAPTERQLAPREVVPLQVIAIWSDGRREDVTLLATYQTNHDTLLTVDEQGRVVAGDSPGVAAAMATYLGQVAVFQAIMPRIEPLDVESQNRLADDLASGDPIDRAVAERLTKLRISPSEPCDDATFVRRAFLDVIGTLPTPDEARAFLSDAEPDRRARLVDRLLQRPEFGDFWGMKWADTLRVNRRVLGRKAAQAYHGWIRDSFARNMPLDRFATELLVADGPTSESPATWFYKANPQPHEMVNVVSQTLLGVRMECARCHHHPWDRWSQTDYVGMQAFFSQTAFKPLAYASSKEAGGAEALVDNPTGDARHPRTGEVVHAHALGQPRPTEPTPGKRREALAAWLTSPENPWFARNIANRAWAHFLGRGLVEPVDDFRMTNPPSNPALLDSLAKTLVDSRFDFRRLVRAIVLSRTYQRGTKPNDTNAIDEQNYSRYPLKRLDAETLLDAVCQATGAPERFAGAPEGTRAIALWDSHTPHYFLELFGRPTRETACQCERVVEPTVSQTLHLLNSPELNDKLRRDDGRVARLVATHADDGRLVDELYWTFLSRLPSSTERTATIEHLARSAARREGAEDVAWSLMNSLEFMFNH